MRSLSGLGARNLSRRKGRTLLTAGGTALGVAVLFAVLVTTAAAGEALDRSLAGQAGEADVIIDPSGTFDGSLPPDTQARVEAVEGVRNALPTLTLRGLLQAPGASRSLSSRDGIVIVIGADLDAATQVKDLVVESGRLPQPGAEEIAVPRRLAGNLDLDLDGPAELTTATGRHPVTVVGLLADAGAGLSYQGSVGFTTVEVAQRFHGRDGVINRLEVTLDDSLDPQAWIADHQEALGAGLILRPAEDVAEDYEAFINSVMGGLTLMSAIALFVGGFLAFLTFSLAVAERTKTYGTLRALGALPRQVGRVVVFEAVVLGGLASAIGVLLGLGLALAARGLVAGLLGLTMPPIGRPVGEAAFSMVVGIVTAILAAWLPGRRAAAASPLDAMRSTPSGLTAKGRAVPRMVLFVVAAVVAFSGLSTSLQALAIMCMLLGAVLSVPFVLGPTARIVGRATARLGRGVGDIVVLHLVKERSRSAYTLGLVMVVLAMLIAVGGTNAATAETLDSIISRQSGRNLQVGAPAAFDPSVADELAQIEGVAAVSPIRFGRVEIVAGDSDPVNSDVTVVDPASYFALSGFSYRDGDDAASKLALASGGSVLLPTNLATQLDVGRGDGLEISTVDGSRSFAIAGVYDSLGSGFGPVVGVADADSMGDGRPHVFLVEPGPGVGADVLAARVSSELGDRYTMVIDTPADTRAWAFGQLRGFFSLAYMVLGLAALIGMLGLANTLAVSVLARTREIGILRSNGTVHGQIWRMVLVEACTLSAVAFALAMPLGGLLTAGLSAQQQDLGLGFVFPWVMVIPLAAVTMIIATVASVVPGRAAARLQPVTALRFD